MARRRSSPYKFLASYGARDRNRFFGRALETDVLLADIVVSRIVVLFAKTGTGKTSLVNAGVRPQLRDRGYRTYLVRVREDPFGETRQELAKQARGRFPSAGTLTEQLKGLAQNVKAPIVIFFDQFEEFFQYTVTENVTAAQDFVATVGDLYDDPEAGVRFVFSMREEWFVEMGIFRDRIPAIFHNDSNLRLRWLSREQAREAIVRPAGPDAYEPELVDTLIEELASTSKAVAPTPSPGEIEPAQLQILCDTVWRRAADGTITLDAYRALRDERSTGSVAQQILDRRLVEEFEDFDRPQLQLVSALLPELETDVGTKRVREYEDLVGALLSRPGLTTDRASIRALVLRLDRERLLDLLPRESGEIVELTHDYLVLRLHDLRERIALIWPRKVLAEGVKAFRRDRVLLHSTVIGDVIAAAPSLVLRPIEGELLLRSALGHLQDVAPVLPALLASGAPVWRIFKERVESGGEAERARAVETLVLLDSPEAHAVLQDALGHDVVSAEVIRLLGRTSTLGAIDLLRDALASKNLAREAEHALAQIASRPGRPDIAGRARAELSTVIFGTTADKPVADVDRIVRLDATVSVELLEEAGSRGASAEAVRNGLLVLERSTDAAVAARARSALLDRVEQALAAGHPERWVVDALVQVADTRAVELLGRMLGQRLHAARARQALEALKQSESTDVAAAATRQLEGVVAPEPPPPPPPTPPAPSTPGPELAAHFDYVLRLLSNGRIVPFLGPGVVFVDRPHDAGWREGSFLPTGAELARHLAEQFAFPEPEAPDLLRVSQYVEAVLGARPLHGALREIFSLESKPSSLHRLLARLPSRFREREGRTQVILTTAFDDMLERAFHEAAEPVDVLTYMSHGPERGHFLHRRPDGERVLIENAYEYVDLSPGERTIVVKLHGGVDRDDPARDSFVVTEDDYIEYALRAADLQSFLPAVLRAVLADASMLFLGYSLRDWNVRILLHAMWRDERRYVKSWAVQLAPDMIDVELWRRRDVDIFDVRLDDYVAELERRLEDFDVGLVPA